MLQLRPYQPSDAAAIIPWIGDEIAFRKWCADRYERYPITPEDMNRNYASLREPDRYYPMTAFDATGIVGHLLLRFTDEERTVIRFGFVIVDPKKRGMGYGRKMLQAAIRYAFDQLKADRITLGVFQNNEAAYRCYKSVGFREAASDQTEVFPIFGEEWKCLEMEWIKE